MADHASTLDYQPAHPPRRISLRSVVMFAALSTAVGYQLLFHLSPDAPMRSPGVRVPALERVQQTLDRTDKLLLDASHGKNIELHFGRDSRAFGKLFSTIYFHSNYTLYPRRLLLGQDDTVVNNADEMFKADITPTDEWMKRQSVAALVTLIGVEPGEPPAVAVRPLH